MQFWKPRSSKVYLLRWSVTLLSLQCFCFWLNRKSLLAALSTASTQDNINPSLTLGQHTKGGNKRSIASGALCLDTKINQKSDRLTFTWNPNRQWLREFEDRLQYKVLQLYTEELGGESHCFSVFLFFLLRGFKVQCNSFAESYGITVLNIFFII